MTLTLMRRIVLTTLIFAPSIAVGGTNLPWEIIYCYDADADVVSAVAASGCAGVIVTAEEAERHRQARTARLRAVLPRRPAAPERGETAGKANPAIAPFATPVPAPPLKVAKPEPTDRAAGVVFAPEIVRPRSADELVGVRFVNRGKTSAPPRVVSFGQPFKAGDLMATQGLVVRFEGHSVPVQIDVKATYRDGSVRHAVLTLRAPALAAGAAVDLMLTKTERPSPSLPIAAETLLAGGYDVQAAFNFGDGNPVIANAASALRAAVHQGKLRPWLSGPLIAEFRVETELNLHLRAVFDIRIDADHRQRTTLIVANDATFTAGNRTYQYSVDLRKNGRSLSTIAAIKHHRNANWKTVISDDPLDSVAILRDVGYLNSTGAIPQLDLSLGINAAILDRELQALRVANTGPMGNALVTTYIPTTGGRADIGPTTAWSARYLVSQDERAEQVMLATADASGSAPWHFRDEATGDPLRLDLRPGFWIDERATAGYGPTTTFSNVLQDTGWELDRAHMPALSYVSYLVTGEHYYLDEMQYEASWQLASISYRGVPETQPIRDIAWSLRDLGNVAYVTPDSDPLKGYFTTMVNQKLDELVKHYITDRSMQAAGEVEGWIRYEGNGTSTPPWQQDYMATSLGVLNSQGFSQAGVLLKWMDNFISGRFIHEAEGYNPLNGPSYGLTVEDPVTKVLYSTWKQVYDATFPPGTAAPTQLDGYPDTAGGYAAVAKAALASIISATGSAKAIQAYRLIETAMKKAQSDYRNNPTWAIVPRSPDRRPAGAGTNSRMPDRP